jgi:hypothetical protein
MITAAIISAVVSLILYRIGNNYSLTKKIYLIKKKKKYLR